MAAPPQHHDRSCFQQFEIVELPTIYRLITKKEIREPNPKPIKGDLLMEGVTSPLKPMQEEKTQKK